MTRNQAILALLLLFFIVVLALSTPPPHPIAEEPASSSLPQNGTIIEPIITPKLTPEENENMTIWAAHLYVPTASSAATYLSDTTLQRAQEMGITHLHLWEYNFDMNTRSITRTQLVDVCQRMQNYNLEPIIDLEYNVTEATALVTALGSNCMMYEVGKEPHISSTAGYATVSQYVSYFNSIVASCRAVNPEALYGGPTVGSPTTSPESRSGVYVNAYLQQCDGDFLSVHTYPEGGSKSGCITHVQSDLASDVTQLQAKMATYSHSMPIVISEIQYTAGVQSGTNPSTNWSWDESFMDQWTTACMNTAKTQGYHTIVFWVLIGYDNNFAILRTPSQSYYRKPQFYSIQDYIASEGAVTYNKNFSMNASLLKQQYKNFNMAASLLSQQTKSFSMAASLEAVAPLCAWGTPSQEHWDIFHSKGDVNGDGAIDATDLQLILDHYTEIGDPSWIEEDINNDGIIDGRDLATCTAYQGIDICDLNVQVTPFLMDACLQESSKVVPFTMDASLQTSSVVDFSMGASLEAVVVDVAPNFGVLIAQLEQLPQPRKITIGEG